MSARASHIWNRLAVTWNGQARSLLDWPGQARPSLPGQARCGLPGLPLPGVPACPGHARPSHGLPWPVADRRAVPVLTLLPRRLSRTDNNGSQHNRQLSDLQGRPWRPAAPAPTHVDQLAPAVERLVAAPSDVQPQLAAGTAPAPMLVDPR